MEKCLYYSDSPKSNFTTLILRSIYYFKLLLRAFGSKLKCGVANNTSFAPLFLTQPRILKMQHSTVSGRKLSLLWQAAVENKTWPFLYLVKILFLYAQLPYFKSYAYLIFNLKCPTIKEYDNK